MPMDYVEEFGPISSTCGQTALVELRRKTHKRSINVSFLHFSSKEPTTEMFCPHTTFHIYYSIIFGRSFVFGKTRHLLKSGPNGKKKLLLLSHMERSEMPGKVRWRWIVGSFGRISRVSRTKEFFSGVRMRLSHLDTYLSSRMHIKDTKYGEFSSQRLAGPGGCSK